MLAINEVGRTYRRNPTASLSGFVNEADHVATARVDAAAKGLPARSVRLSSTSKRSPDIAVSRGADVTHYSAKACASADATADAQRGYGDMQRLVPADQVDGVRARARRGATAGRGTGHSRHDIRADWEAVDVGTTDRISDGRAHSTPRTLNETRDLADKAREQQVTRADIAGDIRGRMLDGAGAGARRGAAVGAVVSIAAEGWEAVRRVHDDGHDLGEALREAGANVLRDTATGTLKGGVAGAAEGTMQVFAARASSKAAQGVLSSGIGGALAIGAIDAASSTVKLARGEIDGANYRQELKQAAGQGALAYVGAALGAIGGPAGSLVGSLLLPFVVRKLFAPEA